MDDGDVITMSKRGQWVNRVVGGEELSQSFRSREEVEQSQRLPEGRSTQVKPFSQVVLPQRRALRNRASNDGLT